VQRLVCGGDAAFCSITLDTCFCFVDNMVPPNVDLFVWIIESSLWHLSPISAAIAHIFTQFPFRSILRRSDLRH